MLHPKFSIQRRNGAYRFHLTASDGEIVLVSQLYGTVGEVENGVLSVRLNAAIEERYERRRSRREQPYFVLKSASGDVLGTSEMYTSGAGVDSGIAVVQKAAREARVERWGEG